MTLVQSPVWMIVEFAIVIAFVILSWSYDNLLLYFVYFLPFVVRNVVVVGLPFLVWRASLLKSRALLTFAYVITRLTSAYALIITVHKIAPMAKEETLCPFINAVLLIASVHISFFAYKYFVLLLRHSIIALKGYSIGAELWTNELTPYLLLLMTTAHIPIRIQRKVNVPSAKSLWLMEIFARILHVPYADNPSVIVKTTFCYSSGTI